MRRDRISGLAVPVCNPAPPWLGDRAHNLTVFVRFIEYLIIAAVAVTAVFSVFEYLRFDRERDKFKLAESPIQLEMTESLLAPGDRVAETLSQLREMGFTIAVDDFGTGYSSLPRIRQQPVDVLKMDKSLLRDVPGNPDNKAIVRAVILMGHGLGLRVTAEGVETAAQLKFLRNQGCDLAQGYHIGGPVPAPQLGVWLKRGIMLPARGDTASNRQDISSA